MNRPHFGKRLVLWLALLTCVVPPGVRAAVPSPDDPPEPPPARQEERFPRAAAKAAPHEAIASSVNAHEAVRIPHSPPPPIVERPGASSPDPSARWFEGYWEWDAPRRDFVWVTGTWHTPPPGRFWVNGYWRRDERGWYRVSGFWCARKESADQTTHTVARPNFPAPSVSSEPLNGAPTPQTSLLPLPPSSPKNPDTTSIAVNDAAVQLVTAPAPQLVGVEPTPAVSASVVALADQLAGQALAFEQVFGRTARVTPQGGAFLADARRLRGDAALLRQAAASGDAPRAALAYRDINIAWRQMADRAARIAPGWSGPNVQQIWRIGQTAESLASFFP